MTRVFRAKFMDGLEELKRKGELDFTGEAEKYRNSYEWKEMVNRCYSKEWNIEIKQYLTPGQSKDGYPSVSRAIEYFARYANRAAISPSRILSWNDEGITFKYKHYFDGGYEMKEMTLTPEEFIRRFLIHVMPKYCQKIRYAGFLAGCVRNKNLELIHSFLDAPYEPSPVRGMKASELAELFLGDKRAVCSKCHVIMNTASERLKLLDAARLARQMRAKAGMSTLPGIP